MEYILSRELVEMKRRKRDNGSRTGYVERGRVMGYVKRETSKLYQLVRD